MASREQNYSQENEKQEASHFPTQLTSLLLSAPSYMIWVPKSDKDLFEFPLDNHQILCFLTYLLLDIMWGQRIKLIQVASNSESRENQWKDLRSLKN